MKEIIYRILREKGLLISDAPDIFSAMGEILHEAAEKTKREEPYATESIRKLQEFSQMVDDFDYFVEMHP
jgi:hypothetical protein